MKPTKSMIPALLRLASVFLLAGGIIVAGNSKVAFTNACEAIGNHGVARWAAKTDPEKPPVDGSIPAVAPWQMAAWPPLDGVTEDSPRDIKEQDFYTLSGVLSKIKVEQDGDIHIEIKDESDDMAVVAEIPLGDTWCALRNLVFGWTTETFPFDFESGKQLTIKEGAPIWITVTGKRFYDVDHKDATTPNRRPGEPNTAVWEIHPIMDLTFEKDSPDQL